MATTPGGEASTARVILSYSGFISMHANPPQKYFQCAIQVSDTMSSSTSGPTVHTDIRDSSFLIPYNVVS